MEEHASPCAAAVKLDEKVRFLASAAAWPEMGRPDVIETHMSWVFLGGESVLKLKKPVRTEFLDFSTLAAREFNCREEVRLNLRLAPGVYVGVLPLVQMPDGALAVGSSVAVIGTVIEWLVQMRRIPRERMLDVALSSGRVQIEDIDRLGERLAQFFRSAERVQLDGPAYVQRFAASQSVNKGVLLLPSFREEATVAALGEFDRALQRHAKILGARAEAGRLREGHGDLRPEHIGLDGMPVVIDCLEFNRALREVDPFDELAFLDLECRMLGVDWIGTRLIANCAAALRDLPPPEVMALYAAHRALVRARLALTHLLDANPRTPDRWMPQARRYVAAARAALAPLLPNETSRG
jgi:aminoglycoside phosphotransferase family enzyme